jgi:hypothetical protein
MHKTSNRLEPGGTLEAVVAEETIREWVKARGASIDALGIHIGVDDAPIIGGLALLVVYLWLYQCVRKERTTIARLIEDTEVAPAFDAGERSTLAKRRWHIFHAIESHSLFVNVKVNSPTARSRVDSLMVYSVFALPVIASIVAFALDRVSYSQPTFIRPHDPHPARTVGPVWSDIFNHGTVYSWTPCFILLCFTCALTVLHVNRLGKQLHEYGRETLKLKP